MHAAIRSYRVMDAEAFVQKVEDEFVERVKRVSGFVGYYVVDGEDGTATTITVGETERAVQASTERADRGSWKGPPTSSKVRLTSPPARFESAPSVDRSRARRMTITA